MRNGPFHSLVKASVLLSVILIFVEIDILKTADTDRVPIHFLVIEAAIVLVMSLDLVLRIRELIASGAGLKKCLTSTEIWIDLLCIGPFIVSLFAPAAWYGFLRALRVLRLLKFHHYSPSAQAIVRALLDRKKEFSVVGSITFVVAILGAVGIYELEHVAQPDAFGTISDSLWWMIVTMTTVGYGDISPQTPEGKTFAMLIMPLSLGIMGAVIGVVGGAFQDIDVQDDAESNQKTS